MPEAVRGTLNPQIKEVQIGVRELRTISVYPLSVRDQLNAKELVTNTVKTLFEGYENPEDVENEEFITKVINAVTLSLDQIVKWVVDQKEGEDILSDMTNEQLYKIGEIVYEVNYSFLSKLVGKLWTKLTPPQKQSLSQSTISSPQSVESTDTNQESSSV